MFALRPLRLVLATICFGIYASVFAISGVNQPAGSTVKLDSAVFVGNTSQGVTKFLGIRYAQPPVGALRFERPIPNGPYSGEIDATVYGKACSQGAYNSSADLTTPSLDNGEDCLFLNVVKPANATASSKLPVVVWIHGGAFTSGSSTANDGGSIVVRSMQQSLPIIYVSMNYRLNIFGFLPGREVKAAGTGNLGLRDQRLALKWIQKYIQAFGGDPAKVTIWGESAGAASVASQLIAYDANPKGLFRAAFMQSGSPIGTAGLEYGQNIYDRIVAEVGCSSSTNTLKCLKSADFSRLVKAVNAIPDLASYTSLHRAWTPRADGDFIRAPAQQLVAQQQVSRVSFVTGDCDDEGTLFSTGNLNITTSDKLFQYLHSNYYPQASNEEITAIMSAYPDDVTKGSPFDTGTNNSITPQYKRIAAFTGDYGYQAPRRFFLDKLAHRQNSWAYLTKRNKTTPYLGSYHASDVSWIYDGGELTDGLIRLATNLNPGETWPQYNSKTRRLLTFYDDLPTNITLDTYRDQPMRLLNYLSLKYPY